MNATASPIAVPTQTGAARRAASGRKRLGLTLLIGVAALACLGLVFQTTATALDRRAYPAPGQMLDVGGRTMHLLCTGANLDGRPTVILEQGGGGNALAWFQVQPELAQSTRVCSYDRAGQGWSQPGPLPRDGTHIASDLHALLAEAGITGPYVLAGHSYGGAFIRVFASQYPDEVAGLVLLDSAHPDQWTRTPEGQAEFANQARLYAGGRVLARFGLLRLGPNPFAATPADWPADLRAQWRALASTNQFWDTTAAESSAIPDTMSQLRAVPPLPAGLPLAVVTAGANTGPDGDWRQYQAELAALSTSSIHRVVEGASHVDLWADARYVPASVTAILDVVEAARTGNSLAAE
jgi:pimeloyl-ACP methyl ester carboxylesterase